MRSYEMVVVSSPDVVGTKQKTFLDKVKKIVDVSGGKTDEVVEWGKQPLSYPIKKQKEGVYFLLNLELEPSRVFALDQKIKLEDNVVRHLIVARLVRSSSKKAKKEKTRRIKKS